MFKTLLGQKLNMSQVFNEDGEITPVTLIKAGPCVVADFKNIEKHGYDAVVLGFGTSKKLSKPLKVYLAKRIKQTPRFLKEFPFKSDLDLKLGQEITVESFEVGDVVQVSGISKGKGFAGVIKRHGFHRGPETHGSDHHRAPGSIGSMYPEHVRKGKRLPGRMGNDRVTVKNLVVAGIDLENNIIAISGAVPGARNSILEIVGKS